MEGILGLNLKIIREFMILNKFKKLTRKLSMNLKLEKFWIAFRKNKYVKASIKYKNR